MLNPILVLILGIVLATPREEFEAIKADYEAKSKVWEVRYSGPPDKPIPQDKVDNVGRYRDWPGWEYAARAQAFAEAHPDDPAGADAQFSMMDLVSSVGDRDREIAPHVAKAYAELARSHVDDPRINGILKTVAISGALPDAELFLRAVAERASDRGVRGRAHLALARFLATRREIAQKPWFDQKDGPEYVARMIERLDPNYVQFVRATDPKVLLIEVKAQIDRTIKEYGDVTVGLNLKGTVAQNAANLIEEDKKPEP